MKKITKFLLLIFLLIPLSVSAKENTLSFSEKDKKIVYEKDLINADKFLKYSNMMPGETYNDELTIKNNASRLYTLYFKLESSETDKSLELLQNIQIKVLLAGQKIYEGNILEAKSNDNEKQALLLGEFPTSTESKMTVETTLSEDYTINPTESVNANLDWKFYARYGDEEIKEVVATENTAMNASKNMVIIAILFMVIGSFLIIGIKRKSN